MSEVKPVQLRGVVQNYDWGKDFSSSVIPKLSGETDSQRPYAELWFGSHPNGTATVLDENRPLDAYLNDYGKAALGSDLSELPFLFKILSVGQPLSIQAHPSLSHAIELQLQSLMH